MFANFQSCAAHKLGRCLNQIKSGDAATATPSGSVVTRPLVERDGTGLALDLVPSSTIQYQYQHKADSGARVTLLIY